MATAEYVDTPDVHEKHIGFIVRFIFCLELFLKMIRFYVMIFVYSIRIDMAELDYFNQSSVLCLIDIVVVIESF